MSLNLKSLLKNNPEKVIAEGIEKTTSESGQLLTNLLEEDKALATRETKPYRSSASIFSNFSQFKCNMSIIEIIEQIEKETYKEQVQQLRNLLAEGKQIEADQFKKKLPAFTASGTFDKGRKAELLQIYSHFIILDIDDLSPDKLQPVFQQAANLPTTFCCFRSPSGNGLKIIVQVTSEADKHEQAFKQVAYYYQEQLQVVIDRSGKDVSRLCFFSSDPTMYKNINSLPFQVTEEQTPPPAEVVATVTPDVDYAAIFKTIVEFTQKKVAYVNGSRNRFVYLLASNCNRKGIPEQEALQFVLQDFNYNEVEVRSSVQSAYKNKVEFGKFAQLAQKDLTANQGDTEDFSDKLLNTPYIPEEVYQQLPKLLQQGCEHFQHAREKDLFLTGAITILSGCMIGVYGTYDQRTVYPNLFSFSIAPPASGKGALSFAKELGMTHHRNMVLESKEKLKQYQAEFEQYRATKKGKKKEDTTPDDTPPNKPNFKVLYIPANSSSAAVIGHLEQSDGIGIICETEADTMGNSFKQDWGGYSDLLRKAFHHEPVTYSRKTNNEFVEVEKPRISVALSGTPSQVQGLISSAEDGLFSRFIFYTFKVKPQWRDVSPKSKVNLTEHFSILSVEVDILAKYLELLPTEFHLTPEQWQFLNSKFELWLKEISTFVSEEASSTVKRLALIVFRIAMVLSAIRKVEDGVADKDITCEDMDFQTAFALAEVYKQHAMLMFAALPKSEETKLDQNKKKFYDALPDDKEFTRQEAVEIGLAVGIKERTVGKYLHNFLNSFLEQPIKYGPYRKKQ